jgi:hypothetical protein
MDDHNAHHFWGASPALDLLELVPHGSETCPTLGIIQVSFYKSNGSGLRRPPFLLGTTTKCDLRTSQDHLLCMDLISSLREKLS